MTKKKHTPKKRGRPRVNFAGPLFDIAQGREPQRYRSLDAWQRNVEQKSRKVLQGIRDNRASANPKTDRQLAEHLGMSYSHFRRFKPSRLKWAPEE